MSMDKKERYYDYIINDLIDTTQIIGDDGDNYWSEVEFPFDKGSTYGIRYLNLRGHDNMGKTFFKLFIKFAHYIVNVYGVKPEEFSMIWNRYLDELVDKWGINIEKLPK